MSKSIPSKYDAMLPSIHEAIQRGDTVRQAADKLGVSSGALARIWKRERLLLQAERDKLPTLSGDDPATTGKQTVGKGGAQNTTGEGLNAATSSDGATVSDILSQARLKAADTMLKASSGLDVSAGAVNAAKSMLIKYGDMEPEQEERASTYENYTDEELRERMIEASKVLALV